MDVQTEAAETGRISPKRLWFGLCAAAAALGIDGFVCFLISTQACADGTGSWGPLPGPGVRILLGCITAGFLVVAIIAGLISYRNWRELAGQREITRAEGWGREEFMALGGVFVAVTCGVGIVWTGIALAFMNVCINAR